MELRIDGRICDLGTDRIAVPGYDVARAETIDNAREGRALTIRIPRSKQNDDITMLCIRYKR